MNCLKLCVSGGKQLKLKAVAIDGDLGPVHQDSVQFDSELPEFRTHGGVHIHPDGLTVTSPVLMWVKALDLLLDRMKAAGFGFSRVRALSGSGQQHGAVFWRTGAARTLTQLDPGQNLHQQLTDSFSVQDSPVWMDSSSGLQCDALQEAAGGAMRLADITGSRAYERFTGNQISKVRQTRPDQFQDTERISLVSSFGASLFLGRYAAIDYSDGSGMNLLDIRDRMWSQICLDATATNLERLLGEPCPSTAVLVTGLTGLLLFTGSFLSLLVLLGVAGPRFVLSAASLWFLWELQHCGVHWRQPSVSGRNVSPSRGHRGESRLSSMSPSSVSLSPLSLQVSLGTSDTLFLSLSEPRPSLEGHVFCNPVEPDGFMALLCFKNGSLTRERVRDRCCSGSWDVFSQALDGTPLGNHGNIGFYFDTMEITPPAVGLHRFDANDRQVSSWSPELEVRALVEGQFLSRRLHAERLGYSIGSGTRVLATGGASANRQILQVLSDVFNAPVYTIDLSDSACLGSAYRALHGLVADSGVSFLDLLRNAPEPQQVCRPHRSAPQVYDPMLRRFAELEQKVLEKSRF
ncbi:xylulose kinase isoform X4 [Poecilia latipinna]|uniref:xylulose kinase isoform X4 n=1 Tax=Poecilia latipinna TaxID=48699 RepID=UPI00072DF144|nr:PREDICTED: xylulose kinase isoform X4 [Poecilia latipinna]XP_014912126.1 PREDICTED: xylulose kinase isoform X4 [Poecilia latipinna]